MTEGHIRCPAAPSAGAATPPELDTPADPAPIHASRLAERATGAVQLLTDLNGANNPAPRHGRRAPTNPATADRGIDRQPVVSDRDDSMESDQSSPDDAVDLPYPATEATTMTHPRLRQEPLGIRRSLVLV